MIETEVHYPTDVNLLMNAMRCLLREVDRSSRRHGVDSWRQWRHPTRLVRALFNRVRSTRRATGHPDRMEAYLDRCRDLVERAQGSLADLAPMVRNPGSC